MASRPTITPQRRSIRLKGYDYSWAAACFFTACVQARVCLFGEVVNGEACVNDAGCMVRRWFAKLGDKFPMVDPGEHVVMPNHFHGIILIRDADIVPSVGAALRGRPQDGRPHGGAPTLGHVVRWFKTMTTNDYIRGVRCDGWTPFPDRLWQRSYYEHVIRNHDELNKMCRYMADNPLAWAPDRENPARVEGAVGAPTAGSRSELHDDVERILGLRQ